jgi:hypothetical protein
MSVLGEARDAGAIAAIAPHLVHEYPLVRDYAHRALENITQQPVPIEVGGSVAAIRAATDAWLRASSARP